MSALSILAVAGEFPTLFVLVYAVGFIAAVFIGLIAWYNSKRPVGFERTKRPNYIPKINTGVDQEPFRFQDYETIVDTSTEAEITDTATDNDQNSQETPPSQG